MKKRAISYQLSAVSFGAAMLALPFVASGQRGLPGPDQGKELDAIQGEEFILLALMLSNSGKTKAQSVRLDSAGPSMPCGTKIASARVSAEMEPRERFHLSGNRSSRPLKKSS